MTELPHGDDLVNVAAASADFWRDALLNKIREAIKAEQRDIILVRRELPHALYMELINKNYRVICGTRLFYVSW